MRSYIFISVIKYLSILMKNERVLRRWPKSRIIIFIDRYWDFKVLMQTGISLCFVMSHFPSLSLWGVFACGALSRYYPDIPYVISWWFSHCENPLYEQCGFLTRQPFLIGRRIWLGKNLNRWKKSSKWTKNHFFRDNLDQFWLKLEVEASRSGTSARSKRMSNLIDITKIAAKTAISKS